MNEEITNTTNNYKAIVIGASAGGLHVLIELFKNLPIDYPLPIIVVQHRSKEPNDLLEEVLQPKCLIKIKQADEKERIENGTIYIAPPDYHLMVERDMTFSLAHDEPVKYSRPSIDVLFESAAAVFKNTLVGIILTGTNSDGAEGIKTIFEYGGLTIVQSPNESQFPVMPLASIATKKVKYIWTLEKIADFLLMLNKV